MLMEITLWHIIFLLIGAGVAGIAVAVAFVMRPVVMRYLQMSSRAREIAEIVRTQEEQGKHLFYVDESFMKRLGKRLRDKKVDLEKLIEEIEDKE